MKQEHNNSKKQQTKIRLDNELERSLVSDVKWVKVPDI